MDAMSVQWAGLNHLALITTPLWPIKLLTGHYESRDQEPLAAIACTLPGK